MSNTYNMEEEIFALKFELTALSEIVLRNNSERWIPKFIHSVTEHDHIERYKLASTLSKDKNVIDIACGVGFGTNMLANLGQAKSVLGCDLDDEAIRYARHRNSSVNVIFKVENAEQFNESNTYDLAISFETIEHLREYNDFLKNIHSALNENGVFIVSTPISDKAFDASPANPYHVQEWGFLEFQELLSNYFKIEEVYTQLHQNAFYNEKHIEARNASVLNNGKLPRIMRKFKRLLSTTSAVSFSETKLRYKYDSIENYSKLEKYEGQYSLEKIGKVYGGYQILICRK